MPDLSDLPPDPFDEEPDPFAVERSERLVRENAAPSDPRWDHLGGEPTLDDFDAAERELNSCEDGSTGAPQDCGEGPFTRMLPWVSAIALLVVLAMIATYVLR